MTRCPHCQRARWPHWLFWAALLASLTNAATVVRNDKEYRQVRVIRADAEALLAEWQTKKCVPRPASLRAPLVSAQ